MASNHTLLQQISMLIVKKNANFIMHLLLNIEKKRKRFMWNSQKCRFFRGLL